MKMGVGEIIVALTLLFGGAFAGSSYQKNKCDKELQEVLEKSSLQLDSLDNHLMIANLKLDSLQSLPAKVDTVIKFQTQIIERTDTLILVNKEILLNTDTIKSELREHVKKVENDHAALR